jgi:quinol-cytochrome oxidoreductase complex cytochrome b subunit
VSTFLVLGWIGQKPVESPFIEIGAGLTVLYFAFLLFFIPIIALIEISLLKKESVSSEELS